MFQELQYKDEGFVGFGGNQKGKIRGNGSVGIDSLSIKNVLYVEGLRHNLLRISQLSDNGYDIVLNQNECKAVSQQNKSILFTAKRRSNIYKVIFSELEKQNVKCLLSVDDEQWIWHKRLGHANFKNISKLNKLGLVRGLPNLKYKSYSVCEACQRGKQIKNSFKAKNIVSTSGPLELLHILVQQKLFLLMVKSMDL